MTNSLPWKMALIEIDGLPINSMVIFHGKLLVITRSYHNILFIRASSYGCARAKSWDPNVRLQRQGQVRHTTRPIANCLDIQWISSGYEGIQWISLVLACLSMFDYPISSSHRFSADQMCSWGRFPTPMAARCDDSSGVSAVFP